MDIKQRIYPEAKIGGYSRGDSTVEFFTRIASVLPADGVILDLGAGRGSQYEDHPEDFRTGLMNFKGRCARVVGVDIDEAVMGNKTLDEAHVFDGLHMPFEDESFDLVLCDWVMEHVQNPGALAAELFRVLKPGGYFCARTPNRWGYIGIGANLIPNRLHVALLKLLQPGRREIDVFPTVYKANSKRALALIFATPKWSLTSYAINGDPAYFGRSVVLWRLAQLMFRLTPPGFEAVMLIFARKAQ